MEDGRGDRPHDLAGAGEFGELERLAAAQECAVGRGIGGGEAVAVDHAGGIHDRTVGMTGGVGVVVGAAGCGGGEGTGQQAKILLS